MEGHDMQYLVTRRTAVQAAVAALLLTALAACSSSSGADRDTATAQTVATEPPTTTTTNPYAVPAVIDAAYVNRVLAGLDAQMGDVTRLVLRTRTIPREAYDRMRAIYGTDERLQLAIDGFQLDMRRGFAGYREVPGNKVSNVAELLRSSPSCIFARVVRDYSPIGENSKTADVQWIALRRLQNERDPAGYNSTGWAYIYEGFPPDRLQPSDPCTA
jgi:hypothetical protein